MGKVQIIKIADRAGGFQARRAEMQVHLLQQPVVIGESANHTATRGPARAGRGWSAQVVIRGCRCHGDRTPRRMRSAKLTRPATRAQRREPFRRAYCGQRQR